MTMIRTYSELIRLPSYEERYSYLRLHGKVGRETFGNLRHYNQKFYHSREWKLVRNKVIARDYGCDLGIDGLEINDRIYIHHMNPVEIETFLYGEEEAMRLYLDPEFLICCCYNTHLAIHYGDERLLTSKPIERRPGDTCPWKKGGL